MVMYLKSLLARLHAEEKAQDAFEYLLVIGGISVIVILAMVTPVGDNLIDAVINGVCGAVNNVISTLDCTGITS